MRLTTGAAAIAMLADDHGIDAVLGVNVMIMNVDREAVAAQIGGDHA